MWYFFYPVHLLLLGAAQKALLGSEKYTKDEPPKVSIGDTVRVHLRVKEGNRERICISGRR
mgnify:CR=1 FL=1